MTQSSPGAHRPLPRLLTVQSTAEQLHLSTRSIRRLIAHGDLVVHRIGRSLRISEDDLNLFIIQRRG